MKKVVATRDEYEISDVCLGQGTFGRVYLATRRNDGAQCAVKDVWLRPGQEKHLIREITIQAQIHHPAILGIYGFIPPAEDGSALLITPYMRHGSLLDHLKAIWRNTPLPEGFTKLVFGKSAYGLAQGLRFMHEHRILHRDVKPDNVFLDENWNPKLGDFGLSRKEKVSGEGDFEDVEMTHHLGTGLYMAPELVRDTVPYNASVDVYAFGVTLYMLHTEQPPNALVRDDAKVLIPRQAKQFMQFITAGYRFERLGNINDHVWDLITQCWSGEASARPTMAQVCERMRSPECSIDPERGAEYMEYVAWIEGQPTEYISSRGPLTAPAPVKKESPFRFSRK